jgi:tetratricopeptide (TPR) repeat protein
MSAALLRGSVTVDSYLGGISRDDVRLPEPPKPLAEEFHRTVDRVVEAARRRLERGDSSPDAHYDLGAALGLRASYSATIEGSVRSAFAAAREAFNAHEQVLELDAARKDAGLIVGTYRYMVASFSMPVRWLAYMAGFGGGRGKGVRLIEDAAAYGGENEIESRIALVLIYNRERRYAEALGQLEILRARSPRNRLLWLESGSTALRAGRQEVAERFLNEGIARLGSDARPRMFGEEALWYYKRGVTRARLGRASDAERDLQRALASPGRQWVHGRSHLELGKIALKAGNRAEGLSELRKSIPLAERDNDPEAAAEAKRLLR